MRKFASCALALMLLAARAAWANDTLPIGFAGQTTVKVAANATPTSVNAAVTMGSATHARVCNTGTVLGFFAWASAGTATAHADTDLPLPSGACVVIQADALVNAAAISSTTTAINVYVTPVEGGS